MLAVKYAMEHGFKIFCIFGCMGGRTDMSIATMQTLCYILNNGCTGYVFGENSVVTGVHNGQMFFGTGRSGTISVFAYGGKAEGVNIKGLRYTMEDGTIESDMPIGVSNEFVGTPASVSVKKGTLIITLTNAGFRREFFRKTVTNEFDKPLKRSFRAVFLHKFSSLGKTKRGVIFLKIGKTEYKKYVEKTDVKSNAAADCFWAFVTGGLICTLGQLFLGNLYASLGAAEQSAKTMATVTLCFCRGGSHGNRDFRRHRKTGGGGNPCAHNRFCKRGGVSRNGVQKRGLCYGNGSQALFGCRAGHRLRKPCRGDLRSAVLYFQIALLYNVKRQVLKVKFLPKIFN